MNGADADELRRCSRGKRDTRGEWASAPRGAARNQGGGKAVKGKKKGGSPGGGSLQSARLLAARLATDGPRLQGGGVTGAAASY